MVKQKNIIGIMVFLSLLCSKVFADTLSEDLQFLTIATACIGRYNSGHVSATIKDPVDWYEPPDLRNFMTNLAGAGTRTNTFYGVCFDYAEDMYKLIREFRDILENEGMVKGQWYIATDFTKPENKGKIELYDLANENSFTSKLNNTYVKFVKTINAEPHGENHAWIVVQRTNEQWMWFDPTWTDNSGDVIWGYIENGQEEEYWAEDQFIKDSTVLAAKHRSNNPRVSPPVTATPSTPSTPDKTQNISSSDNYGWLQYTYNPIAPLGISYGNNYAYMDNGITLEEPFVYIGTIGFFVPATNFFYISAGVGLFLRNWEEMALVLQIGPVFKIADILSISAKYKYIFADGGIHTFDIGIGIGW
jgi:hypothetical protein